MVLSIGIISEVFAGWVKLPVSRFATLKPVETVLVSLLCYKETTEGNLSIAF